jgi:hypothetical protein
MNRLQKLSWFNLIIIVASLAMVAIVMAVEMARKGYSSISIYFLAPLVLIKLIPFILKKRHGVDQVIIDERDIAISKKAMAVAYKTFWIIFLSFSFLLFIVIGPRGSVPVITLPLVAIGGALLIRIVCSVSILILYGREGTHE